MLYTEIIHKYGQHACGKPAFLYQNDKLARHAVRQSKYARHLDGAPIGEYSACVCDSCGYVLEPWLVTGEDREI